MFAFRRICFGFWVSLLSGVTLVGSARVSRAGDSLVAAESRSGNPSPMQALREARLAVHAEIQRILQSARPANPDPPSSRPAPENVERSESGKTRLGLLRSIDSVYFHHESLIELKDRLEGDLKTVASQQAKFDEFGVEEPKPYSFRYYESLRDQQDNETVRAAAIKADANSAKQLLETARRELERAVAHRRGAIAVGQEPEHWDPAAPLDAHGPRDLTSLLEAAPAESLAVILARAKLSLAETDVDVQKSRLEVCKNRQKLIQDQIDRVKTDVKFSAADRDAELERLTALESELDSQRSLAETRFHELEADDSDSGDKPSGVGAGIGVGSLEPADRSGESEVWRAAREIYNAHILLVEQQREQIASMRRLWKHRHEFAAGGVAPQTAKQWLAETDEFIDELADWSKSWDHRLGVLGQTATLPARRGAAPPNEESAKWSQYRQTSFQQLRAAHDAARREVARAERSFGRFHDELKAMVAKTASPKGLLGAIHGAWDWEVLHDEKESITFGKLVVLLLYVFGGLLLASLASRLVGMGLLRRLRWHHGRASAFKSILFYGLFLFFGVVAFRALRIPLGAFAFLGGAAAIAIGFGSQDIMNNFMSGIILLTEQPIRVGDVILLEEIEGMVTYIGLRSTRLLTEANHEMIVPNSALLADAVTNLTLTDQFVRHVVTIDVDRNRSVAASKLRMLQLVFSHPMVIKSPQPVVLLTEVDCYALRFQVNFWLEHRSLVRCSQVRSEILEMITAEFPCLDGDSPPAPASEPATRDSAASLDHQLDRDSHDVPDDMNDHEPTPKIHVPSILPNAALTKSIRQMSRAVLKKELKQLR